MEEDELHHRKLYGGAQYHRTLSSFHAYIHNIPIDQSTSDEIALLLHGIPDASNDGVNILRSVAKLSSRKMELIMDDILIEMAKRVEFVLMRMWDVVEYAQLVRENVGFIPTPVEIDAPLFGKMRQPAAKYWVRGHAVRQDGDGDLAEVEKDLILFVKERYRLFVKQRCELCYRMLKEDLMAMFRFVSWDLAFGDRFESTIGVDGCIVNIEGLDDDYEEDEEDEIGNGQHPSADKAALRSSQEEGNLVGRNKAILDHRTDEILKNVMDAVQATVDKSGTGESMGQTCAAINVLVQYVTDRWRKDVSHMIMTKFNAYCMLPLHEDFLGYLRREMGEHLNQKYGTL